MSDQFVTNFTIPAANNIFQLIWKMTRAMKAAGWTTQASSDGATKDTSGIAANDKWGGSVNPLADVYGTNTGNLTDSTDGGWIVMRGPSTVKIPLSANPTGTFIRGETITQATSGAEGEIVGYVWDTGTVSGWAVVLPHTGSFDATHLVTGASSGATFTPTGTIVTYVREFVFSRDPSSAANAKINGWVWYICADVSGEVAQLPTTLASASGCTQIIPPGGGGTSNAFPAKGLIIRGTASSIAYTGWITSSTSTFVPSNNGQICAKNATPGTGVSADGTFYCSATNTVNANGCDLLGFFRLDDSESGDVDPFVAFSHIGQAPSTWNNTISSASATNTNFSNGTLDNNSFIGYQARGCPVTTRDVPGTFVGTGLYYATFGVPLFFVSSAFPSSRVLQNHPSSTPPVLREPVAAMHNGNGTITNSSPTYKGRCRWMAFTTLGTTYDTWDSKLWLVLGVGASGTPVILVAYDGVTTPSL